MLYLEREQKSQQITMLKNLTNTTYIKIHKKWHYMFINELPDTFL